MCVSSQETQLASFVFCSMSNHKLNKLVLTKRPAKFLPDEHQVRRDFGGVSKKPKLDIRLSQSIVSNVSSATLTNDHFGGIQKRNKLDVRLSQSNSSNLPVTYAAASSTNDATLDDVWGEDLSAEAVEECLFLASQVCPEVILDNASTSSQADPQHGPNSNIGSFSRSSSDSQFKIPISSSRQSNLKSKSSAFPTSACRDVQRTSVLPNQNLNSPNAKKNVYSNSQSYLSNPLVTVNRNQPVNGIHVTPQESAALSEEIKKLQLENKDLKDKSLSREGEVSILRQQLKQIQMQLENQRVENISKLEEQAQKFKDQLSEHKKELEITNTQLQFKIMEATTMRNHCKLLESTSKLKLVEPQRSTSSDTGKAKGDCFSQSILPSDISPPKIHPGGSSRLKGQTPTKKPLQKITEVTDSCTEKQRSCSVPRSGSTNSCTRPREGSMLGVAVNEFLFKKSVPEVSWILYIRKKQSLCRRIKEAEDINSTILSLQQNDRTLESCYTAVNRLIAMDLLSSPVAWPYVEKVVEDCQQIVCRQVHILRLLLQVQSKTERVLLSEEIASVIGTLAVKKDRRLMSSKQWYSDEEGVESRRALGLLSVLCDVSHLAADLITGSIQLCSKGDEPDKSDGTRFASGSTSSSMPSSGKKRLPDAPSKVSKYRLQNDPEAGPSHMMEHPKDADTSVMEIDFSSPDCSDSQNSTKPFDLEGFEQGYCEYTRKPFGFLCLLKDLVTSISIQRRTRHFIGVLTGVMAMLKAVVARSSLTGDGLKLMSQIIQEAVFACPQVEVIVAVFDLLRILTPYTDIMNTLCHNCESNVLVDKRYINLTYFSRGSCVMQVLFRLLPKGEMSRTLRTNLCSHMLHWLYNMVCIPSKETSWLLTLQEDATRTCQCKHKLTQGLVITLYNSVCDFEHAIAKGHKLEWELRHILVMGVMVLRNLLQREFGLYFESAEEEYQLLLSKMQMVSDKLELNSMQRECLTDLLNIEEKSDDEKTEIQESFDAYWNESASQCRTLLSSRAPSHKQPPKKPRRSIAQINKAWNIGT